MNWSRLARPTGALLASVLVLAVVGLGAYFINVAATRRASPVTSADCAGANFSAPLGPIDPPSSVHHYSREPAFTIDSERLYQATISGPYGDIVICLVPGWAPQTVNSFVTLIRNRYFDGLRWGRDPSTAPGGPVIQGGSPNNNLTGGPGYQFKDEKVVSPLYHKGAYLPGAVAMANSGPNTNGSQFFITLSSFTLPASYNLFGEVISGLDVPAKVKRGDVMEVTVREQLP
ncbi:MAG TPA: peptidylprolyl isomerase [Candidatus Dormibacteraeota bacterium]|nr:peptidylprolyl isomerase [Candidatus Dormibacteraeota bacterium]